MGEEQMTKKPTAGTWGKMGTQQGGNDRISFDVNVPYTVEFLTDDPEEVPSSEGDGSVFYSFPVKLSSGNESKISTSAWTLLSELKRLSPLKGKRAQITKKLDKGKQKFSVIELQKF